MTITEEAVDAAYSAMCEEIDRWELVGPLQPQPTGEVHHGKPVMCNPYLVRPSILLSGAALTLREKAGQESTFKHFTDKAHAVAFIQYQGLTAALKQFVGESPDPSPAAPDNTVSDPHA